MKGSKDKLSMKGSYTLGLDRSSLFITFLSYKTELACFSYSTR